MANAILLNQSTEVTQDNILSKIGQNLITNIQVNENGNNVLTITYINPQGQTNTTNIDMRTWLSNYISSNIIRFEDDPSYESV